MHCSSVKSKIAVWPSRQWFKVPGRSGMGRIATEVACVSNRCGSVFRHGKPVAIIAHERMRFACCFSLSVTLSLNSRQLMDPWSAHRKRVAVLSAHTFLLFTHGTMRTAIFWAAAHDYTPSQKCCKSRTYYVYSCDRSAQTCTIVTVDTIVLDAICKMWLPPPIQSFHSGSYM